MIPGLDGLRGLAILLVFFLHADYAYIGWVGVQYFKVGVLHNFTRKIKVKCDGFLGTVCPYLEIPEWCPPRLRR